MKNKYLIFASGFLFLILAGIFGFLFWKESQKVTTVNFFNKDNLFYAFWTAEDRGYFKENKLILKHDGDVQLNGVGGDWDKENALFLEYLGETGIDLTAVSLDNLFELENKYPGKYKAFAFMSETSTAYTANIIASKDSSISSSADLSGKTIATSVHNIDQLLVSEYAKKEGFKDYKLVKLPYDDIDKYLEDGKIDAALVQEPKTAKLVAENKAKVIVKNPADLIGGDFKNLPLEAFVINTDFVKNNKKATKRLMAIFNDLTEISEDDFRQALSNHLDASWDGTIKIRNFPVIRLYDQIDSSQLSRLADMLVELNYLAKKPDINNLLYK